MAFAVPALAVPLDNTGLAARNVTLPADDDCDDGEGSNEGDDSDSDDGDDSVSATFFLLLP